LSVKPLYAIVAAVVWFAGLGWLSLNWYLAHGLDLTVILLGVGAVSPAWPFIASEVNVSLFGQKFYIKGRDIEEPLKKISGTAPKLSFAGTGMPSLASDDEPSYLAVSEPTMLGTYLKLRDPKLILMGLRVEIERKINLINAAVGIETHGSILESIRDLENRQILTDDFAGALTMFVKLGNKAAQGAVVDRTATVEVLSAPRTVLPALDAVIKRVQESK
jgi:hypothetical protein